MAKKNNTAWLTASLVVLLAGLVMALVVVSQPHHGSQPAQARHAPAKAPVPARQAETMPAKQKAAPSVAYEDFHSIPDSPSVFDVPPQPAPLPRTRPGIALILDDVGYDLPALQRILQLPISVAISVLPDAPHARRAAEMAHAAGQMVMLHLPMEPENPKYRKDMSAAFLREGMSSADLRKTFLSDLARVPYVQGVNNHMGSLLTQQVAPMKVVMQVCREKGLFFVDSRTTADTVAAKEAADFGLSWAERQVFLDNNLDTASLRKSWDKALACAKRGGTCVVIAHPHPETVEFLSRQLGETDWQRMLPIRAMLRAAPTSGAS